MNPEAQSVVYRVSFLPLAVVVRVSMASEWFMAGKQHDAVIFHCPPSAI